MSISGVYSMKNIKNRTFEAGRTMTEMLGMLAIIGVLSIAAIVGLRYALNKATANRILQDVSLAYGDATTAGERKFDVLYNLPFTPESGYKMQTERIKDEVSPLSYVDIVIVYDVPEKVCEHLKDKRGVNGLSVFELNEVDNVYQGFTVCQEINEMIFTFGFINGICDKECPKNAECRGDKCVCKWGFETINGICEEIICDEKQSIENITKEFCCSEFGGKWDGQLCDCFDGEFLNEGVCEPIPEGFCIYRFEDPEYEVSQSNCSYTFEDPEYEISQSNCSYTFNDPEYEVSQSDCFYTFSQTLNEDEPELSTATASGTQCPDGKYCVLQWSGVTCDWAAGSGSTTVYGYCMPPTETTNYCLPGKNTTASTASGTQCPDGKYCVLQWSGATCDSAAGSGSTTVYGYCMPPTETTNYCLLGQNTTASTASGTQCPDGKYCVLQWSNATCDWAAGSGSTTVYGYCMPPTETTNYCLPGQNTTKSVSTALVGCDDGMYCNLVWGNELCSGVSSGSSVVFGVCNKTTENTTKCPITK